MGGMSKKKVFQLAKGERLARAPAEPQTAWQCAWLGARRQNAAQTRKKERKKEKRRIQCHNNANQSKSKEKKSKQRPKALTVVNHSNTPSSQQSQYTGFRGKAKNCYRVAKPRVQKALQYAYVSRKLRKREFRSLWVQQINAATRQHGLSYSRFMHGLQLADVQLNRRSLAALAQTEPDSFDAVVRVAEDRLRAKWNSLHTPTRTLAL